DRPACVAGTAARCAHGERVFEQGDCLLGDLPGSDLHSCSTKNNTPPTNPRIGSEKTSTERGVPVGVATRITYVGAQASGTQSSEARTPAPPQANGRKSTPACPPMPGAKPVTFVSA